MEPTSPALDTIADLLRRWQGVDGPMERVRVVSDAADTLRDLSALDTRTLAQGLWEHGAGSVAQQVADRAGMSAAPEELAEVASAVLSLDPGEVDRLATELRDPKERQRLLVASGIAAEEAARHVASAPPSDQDRIDAPPPPGAADAAQPVPDADPDAPPPRDAGGDEPPTADAPPGEPPPDGRDGAEAEAPAPTPPSAATTRPGRRTTGKPGWQLAAQLQDAPNGRERLRLLDEAETVLHGAAALRILDAAPDGWQRRTVLRKLVTTDRVRDLPATDVVDRFARNGDRFAVAALLVRTATCDLDDVLPALDPSDAARLRRRASGQTSEVQPSEP